jgi:hypothetical protein
MTTELPRKSEVLTSLDSVPVTKERPLPKDLHLENPGLARVNEAPDTEHPHGSDDAKKNISVLQQHVEFFDRNKDGIVYPYETYAGEAFLSTKDLIPCRLPRIGIQRLVLPNHYVFDPFGNVVSLPKVVDPQSPLPNLSRERAHVHPWL